MNNTLERIVIANSTLSDRIEPSVVKSTHAYERYREVGNALLKLEPKAVLDVGAGKQWHFSHSLKTPGMHLIGFDIDLAEMDGNALLDQKICGDACESLGVPDGSVDLIMGRAVIEHLHDNASFLRNANRALREGGRLVVTFPSRHAPFAILNRILPRPVSQWLLTRFIPGSKGRLGFEAFYDRATFREFSESLTDAGFEIEEGFASYFSSSYFRFFVPLYLLGLSIDYLRYALGKPRFASYFMFVARKPPSTS